MHKSGRRRITTLSATVLGGIVCLASVSRAQSFHSPTTIESSDGRVQIVGRYDGRTHGHPRMGYPGTGLIFRFKGTGANLEIVSDSETAALTVVIDHGPPLLRLLQKGKNVVSIASALEDVAHTVEIYKRADSWQGIVTVDGIELDGAGVLLPPPPLPVRKLMFIGDSVTCGGGVDNNAQCKPDPEHPANNVYDSYGMLLGRRMDAQIQLVCYGGRGLERDYRGLGISDGVLNAPQFLDLAVVTDEPSGRAPWDAALWQADAIVISLGTNDFDLQSSRPLDEKKWVDEYDAFLRDVRREYPRAVIVLTEGAIVVDPLLRQLVQAAAAGAHDPKVFYTPSVHYPGNGCDGHPTRDQHVRMADDFEPVLRQLLGW